MLDLLVILIKMLILTLLNKLVDAEQSITVAPLTFH